MNRQEAIGIVKEMAEDYRDSADLHYMEAYDDFGSYEEEAEKASYCCKCSEALHTLLKLVEQQGE